MKYNIFHKHLLFYLYGYDVCYKNHSLGEFMRLNGIRKVKTHDHHFPTKQQICYKNEEKKWNILMRTYYEYK